ncbi:CarD family transcriptional regulator [Arthrobacter sp. zg-Y820]|uniref:CarD family transcriptional regulator n=1 Tax=unclassified Arthrobacter TaxID=235627 RepID=UPI001E5FD7DC|nr:MULTISPECIES: CarD family transcriptional regulator [unclassified Arthrobacter]MCC9197595.1 CarD family transcriptional regulator [Arthrobacter sp. zg-Y820]MDK1280462.1 CarD family transcriptional regulator [Arthrobacter sp. zg.Y820]MDK1361978.1 CarD family transcriptional regulator [Arthrobacter sp. zg-Y1219]WIB10896.1 CarD family transcriptional regulator [Arthrobacter sp. zg-Y820]
MPLSKGQILVHPHHGPAVVTAFQIHPRLKKECVVLEVQSSRLMVWVPVDQVERVGLRPVLDAAGLEALFRVLGAPADQEDTQWSRRFKDNTEKIATGDPLVIAAVVRNLMLRNAADGLSQAERDMLRQARRPLLTEISLALGISQDDAGVRLDSTWPPFRALA